MTTKQDQQKMSTETSCFTPYSLESFNLYADVLYLSSVVIPPVLEHTKSLNSFNIVLKYVFYLSI